MSDAQTVFSRLNDTFSSGMRRSGVGVVMLQVAGLSHGWTGALLQFRYFRDCGGLGLGLTFPYGSIRTEAVSPQPSWYCLWGEGWGMGD
jgi:hypothetical protein